MIARIRGEVIEHEDNKIIVECAGIGYGVLVCYDEQQRMALGSRTDLYIAEQIKEDAHDLYGFSAKSRRQLFGLLISVNGVGPKAAMAILNIGSEGQVRSAIASGDTKFITAAKGVGKKAAERAIVDLKSKVGLETSDGAIDFLHDAPTMDEAVEALTVLGHSPQHASELLRGIDAALPAGERVKQALRRRI